MTRLRSYATGNLLSTLPASWLMLKTTQKISSPIYASPFTGLRTGGDRLSTEPLRLPHRRPFMNDIPTFAIIPTNGRSCFKDSLYAIEPQVGDVVVVEGGPDAAYVPWVEHPIIREPELNISKWWNLGLTLIESRMTAQNVPQWNVVVLNDDVIVPPGWVLAVTTAMRETGAAAGCSGGSAVPWQVLHTEPGPVGLVTRMKGFAFILAGEKGIRADEKLRWYFSDDHVDWMARRLGGMVMIPGMGVEHLHPNAQMTAELQATVPNDAAHFYSYWGQRPW